MKFIIKCDWACQTIMLVVIFALLVLDEIADAWAFGSCLFLWQGISAVILLILTHGRGPRRLLFLGGVLAYWIAVITGIEILTIGLPIALITCYWLLTTCNLYPTMKYDKGKFLPHTSF
jgi:hypothetical protein